MRNCKGRPRRYDEALCPKCGMPGYFQSVPSWNSQYKGAARNFYFRFIHRDRSIPYCYIGKRLIKKQEFTPLEVAREYHRKTDTVTTFLFHPQRNSFKGVIKQWKKREALRVIVYSFSYIPTALKPELKKLKKLRLSKQELKWLLKQEQEGYGYLRNLPSTDIVTFGEDAVKVADEISKSKSKSNSWHGRIRMFSDKCGLLEEILKRRKLKQIQSEAAFGTEKWNR